jgi:Trypsin-like peptidase domain
VRARSLRADAPSAGIPRADMPWPQVGKVHGTTVGTGFVVGKGRVLTAAHVVDGAAAVRFQLGSTVYGVVGVEPFRDLDAAVLTLEEADGASLPEPLPLCLVPPLPVSYIAWGYWATGGEVPLQGSGRIQARPIPTRLQLRTRSQVPGMSGAPLAIRVRGGGWRVVGLGCARHFPGSFVDDQSLALGCPIEAIPAAVLREIGAVEDPEHCAVTRLPGAEELIRALEERAAHREGRLLLWRTVSGAATLAIAVPALLGLLRLVPFTAASISLAGLVALSWLAHVWARDAGLDAEKSRAMASFVGLVDVESDDPESLLPLLLTLARR